MTNKEITIEDLAKELKELKDIVQNQFDKQNTITRKDIEKIKDPVERQKAIKENMHLFTDNIQSYRGNK